MKLGYIYTVTSDGYDDEKVRINVGDWSSIVEDERQLWLKYSVNGESIAMTLVRDGVVFAITRIIGGDRADDNITTWVFIPSKIQITGSQIKLVLEAIKEINKAGTKKVTQDTFIGDEILAIDYPEKRYMPLSNPSMGSELAGRYPTIDFSMEEILAMPYQEYYTKYKYVFLFNKKNEIKNGLIDLSNENMIETICVLPPSSESIQNIFGSSGVIVKFLDGRVFNTPETVKKGQSINLIAEKDACIPIRVEAKAFMDEKEIEISTANQQWRRIISNNLFEVRDSKSGKTIVSAIKILDSQYNDAEKSLPETRLSNVLIKVTANGYEPFRGEVDLSLGAASILLDKIMEKETYTYWTNAGHEVKVTISGYGAKSRNPLQGYEVKGKNLVYIPERNDDRYKSYRTESPRNTKKRRFAWAEFCYGIIFSILLCLIVWGGIRVYDYFFYNKKQYTENTESATEPIAEETNATEARPSLDQAIAYLDNKDGVWQRDSLINYPKLDGLFEELNSYEFSKILKRESELRNSKNFKKICDAIRSNQNKQLSGTFCGEGDNSITVSNYEKKLNKPVEQTKVPANGGVASDAAKKAQESSDNTSASQNATGNKNTKKQKSKRGGV